MTAEFCPSSSVSCSSASPAAALLIQVTYANGMKVTVPLEEAVVTSDSETLYTKSCGRIVIDAAKVSADTAISFTVNWKGITAEAVLTVTK